MEAVGRQAVHGPVGRVPRRAVAGVLAAVLVVAVVQTYRTTRPYDPLGGAGVVSDIFDGIHSGATVTVVYPLITTSDERPTILSASGAASPHTRIVALHGVVGMRGYGLSFGGAAALAAHDHVRLVPIAGMRFTTADPRSRSSGWLHTHVFVAETLRVTSAQGCFDPPALHLRYTVGGSTFERTVPAPVGFAAPGLNGGTCVEPGGTG
jgi:hypothetical protein